MKPGDVIEVKRVANFVDWDQCLPAWWPAIIDYTTSQEIGVTFADGKVMSVNRHGDRWRELSE